MPAIVELSPGRFVGEGQPCYIVAEVGQNHNGRMELARRLIDEIAHCGVDAVKFCKRDLACELTAEAFQRPYEGRNSFGRTYGEHRQALELSGEQHRELKQRALARGLTWFATACDLPSVDLLESLETPFYKVASRDLGNLPLLEYIARTGKPIILSCGMDGPEAIAAALETVCRYHNRVILLHCTSAYPTPLAEVNLRAMATLRAQFDVPVGLSDHSQGLLVPVLAAALGAVLVEKHVTLDRTLPGSDHVCSLEMSELAAMARQIREAELALGDGVKRVPPSVAAVRARLGRTLVARGPIPPGTRVTEAMLCLKSAGEGLGWADRKIIVGKIARRAIPADGRLTPADVE